MTISLWLGAFAALFLGALENGDEYCRAFVISLFARCNLKSLAVNPKILTKQSGNSLSSKKPHQTITEMSKNCSTKMAIDPYEIDSIRLDSTAISYPLLSSPRLTMSWPPNQHRCNFLRWVPYPLGNYPSLYNYNLKNLMHSPCVHAQGKTN